MPQVQRDELEKTRTERLRDALALFAQVRLAFSGRPDNTLAESEKIYNRNSLFYMGDCAYELADYELAIKHYDEARAEYAAEPSSLVAMVQIVNAYIRRGEWAKAATANERARQHLAKFPETVWSNPDLPMDKKHWERWLDSRALLDQRALAGNGQ